jgi:hypothetical protein
MRNGIHNNSLWLATLLMLGSIFTAHSAHAEEQGVLLLKNQQVLAGKIISLGDYTHVSIGNSSDVRVPKKDVWLIGRDLDDLYQQRMKLLRAGKIEDHLSLADWCVRQQMLSQGAEQLVKAMQLDPRDPRIAMLEKKLQVATVANSSKKVKATAIAATVGHEQLDRTVTELPHGALERFTIMVQPIVMDRCGAGRCHGSGSETNFQIVQPTASRVPSKRFTQRNLFAVMSLVNLAAPQESKLLKKSLEAHGGQKEAPLRNAEDRQYLALQEWVMAASQPTVAKDARPLSVANRPLAGTQRQMSPLPENVTEEGKPNSHKSAKIETASDPFDPTLFNSKYHDLK